MARGASVPEIAGRYLFADYCSGEIFSVRRLGRRGDRRAESQGGVGAGRGTVDRQRDRHRRGRAGGRLRDRLGRGRGLPADDDDAVGGASRPDRPRRDRPGGLPFLDRARRREPRREHRDDSGDLHAGRSSSAAPGGGTVSELIGRGQQKSWPDALAWLRFKGLAIPDASQGSQGGTLRVELTGLGVRRRTASSSRGRRPRPGRGARGSPTPAPRAQDLVAETAVLYGLRETATDRTNLALLSGATAGTTTLRVTLVSGGRTFVLPETVPPRAGGVGPARLGPLPRRLRERLGGRRAALGAGPLLGLRRLQRQRHERRLVRRARTAGPFRRDAGRPRRRRDARLRERARPREPRGAPRHGAPPLGRVARRRARRAGSWRPKRSEPGEQKILPGIVDRLRAKGLPVGGRGGSYAGALFVTFEDGLGTSRPRGTPARGRPRRRPGAAPTGSSPRARAWPSARSARRGSSASARTTP